MLPVLHYLHHPLPRAALALCDPLCSPLALPVVHVAFNWARSLLRVARMFRMPRTCSLPCSWPRMYLRICSRQLLRAPSARPSTRAASPSTCLCASPRPTSTSECSRIPRRASANSPAQYSTPSAGLDLFIARCCAPRRCALRSACVSMRCLPPSAPCLMPCRTCVDAVPLRAVIVYGV
jgi:hypothetical protein